MRLNHSRNKNSLEINNHNRGERMSISRRSSLKKVAQGIRFKEPSQNTEKQIAQFQSTAMRFKYDRAMELIREGDENKKLGALKILHGLCMQIKNAPDDHKLSGQLLQNVVKNYLGLKSLIQMPEKGGMFEELELIRYFTKLFEDGYKQKGRQTGISGQGLSLFFLIQANQEYHYKMFKDALISCQKSIRYCSGTKTQIDSHLMKVYFLKSSVFKMMKDKESQLEAIRACLDIINRLIGVISDLQTKEYVISLKNILSERKREIYHKSQVKNQSVSVSKNNSKPKLSLNKFRRRSISLKKSSSQKEITWKQFQQKSSRDVIPDKVKLTLNSQHKHFESVHFSKTVNHSKHPSINFEQKKEININEKSKLHKKVQLKRVNYNEISKYVIDQIQNQRPQMKYYEELMVARPVGKKKDNRESQNIDQQFQQFQAIPVPLVLEPKKQSEDYKSQRIQPITHQKGEQNYNQARFDDDYELIVEDCIREQEQNLLKGFLKTHYLVEELEDKMNLAVSKKKNTFLSDSSDQLLLKHTPSQEDLSIQPGQQHDTVRKEFLNQKRVTISNGLSNNQNMQRQLYSYGNSDFDISDKVSLCTSFGCLTKINLRVRVLEGQQNQEEKQDHRNVLISFKAILNQDRYVRLEMVYDLVNIFQSDLYAILYELNKQVLPQVEDIPDQISNRLFNLISNQIIVFKKPVGTVIVPKATHIIKTNQRIQRYKQQLRDKFIIYELNNTTSESFRKYLHYFAQSETQKVPKIKSFQKSVRFQKDEVKVTFDIDQNDQEEDMIAQYLPSLIKRLTEDFHDDCSSVSSLKRLKTERFFKYTMFSYRSTMKSIDEGQFNLFIKDDDIKSLNMAIMPCDFQDKISKYFQNDQSGKSLIPFEQFYYCMKFVLIKPENISNREFIDCFYDQLSVECFLFLKESIKVKVKMTCFRAKDIFIRQNEMFFKFQIQFMNERIKTTKFIATSKDLKLIDNLQKKDQNTRNSRRINRNRNTTACEEDSQKMFKRQWMLNTLRQISSHIFVKKDYLYSVVGLQNKNSKLNFINKFRLEGKTVQGKNFMTNHLMQIHILFQKSIMIRCDTIKGFAVVTVRQILNSHEFNLIFYIPKLQRSYTANLNHDLLNYFDSEQLQLIFHEEKMDLTEMKLKLFGLQQKSSLKAFQREAWNRVISLFQFQSRYINNQIQLLLKIGSYCSFLKDSSFSQYFSLEGTIYHLQMSLSKKIDPLSVEVKDRKDKKLKISKRKSNSSKDLPNRRLEFSEQPLKKSYIKNKATMVMEGLPDQIEGDKVFYRQAFFDKFNQIHESSVKSYVLYINLSLILPHKDKKSTENTEHYRPKKINLALYLSDLVHLIKKTKEELHPGRNTSKVDFNQEAFSFALLLRVMTVIKYRLIKQLKIQSEKYNNFISQLFEGEKIFQSQKIFKNKLQEVFKSRNNNFCTLNAFKKLHKLQKNVFVFNKGIMNLKTNQLACFIVNQNKKTISIYIVNNKSLQIKHKILQIEKMKTPWITFLTNSHLSIIDKRINAYYQNVLLLV